MRITVLTLALNIASSKNEFSNVAVFSASVTAGRQEETIIINMRKRVEILHVQVFFIISLLII